MNSRIELQLRKVARVLPCLAAQHVPVYGVQMNPNWVRPVLHTGAGPYFWQSVAMGMDAKGYWIDYVAHLRGVELQRRVRPGPHSRPSIQREARP